MNDYSLLSTAIAASIAAGKAILEVYHTDFEVTAKDDDSPLTRADLAAHSVLTAALGNTALPVISEEGRAIPYDERSGWKEYWLIDPLDGTKEFVRRNGEFTVNAALIRDGRPVLGVVYAPVTDELYAGLVGTGWWYVQSAAEVTSAAWEDLSVFKGVPVSVTHPYRIAISRSHLDPATADYLENRRAEKGNILTVQAGSSMKFCLVAHGKADEYPRFGPTNEWDTAAGHAVLKAAGRNVYSYPDGAVLQYNKPSMINGPFIAR
ncbi:MAG: hypothetical protein RL021_245 [Bacteroidota bacterium]|jgi:3'(2'), 5'-bisphosphate nucleotidase